MILRLLQSIHLSPIVSTVVATIAIAAMLWLLIAVTSRPSNDPDFPPRL